MNNPPVPDDEFELDFSTLIDLSSLTDSIFPAPKNQALGGEKYVVFHLDEKLYAVHSQQVVEVIGFLPVTPLPFVPGWVAGVSNLRGSIISVVNLRKLWKKPTTAAAAAAGAAPKKSKFLILRSEKDNHAVAFVVDKLSEIVTLSAREIEFSAADFESSFPTFFGRVAHKSQTLYLLDAENLFSSLSAAS